MMLLRKYRFAVYVALAGLLLIGIWQLDVSRQKVGYDKAVAEQAIRDKAAEVAARTKEALWQTRIDEVSNDAQNKIDKLQISVADATNAADRLRSAAKIAARNASKNPSTADASAGKSCPDTADLLSTLLDRHSSELVTLGGYADRLRVAGQACEKAYDALMP